MLHWNVSVMFIGICNFFLILTKIMATLHEDLNKTLRINFWVILVSRNISISDCVGERNILSRVWGDHWHLDGFWIG
jgi:hypothetical protein